MIDNKLLEALALVLEEGGFEKAARRLNITQSAVSQRVKMLEESIGQILLTRTSPPAATAAGQTFLCYYQKVKHLESDLPMRALQNPSRFHQTIAIGVNADSLATWFLDAVAAVIESESILLDIHVDDQEETQKLLLNGQVCGCISTHDRPSQGCRVVKLGSVEYGLFCTPSFSEKWFPNGFHVDQHNPAPSIRFNRKDSLNEKYFNSFLGKMAASPPTFFVPSSDIFVECILRSLCYGIIPEQQSKPLCESGQLIDLAPAQKISVPLFYHYWNLHSRTMAVFTRRFIAEATNILRQ